VKENSIEDRINNAYCFLNSMHSDFRTGLYYKEDLENLEHILSAYKRVLKENEKFKKLHIQDNKHLDFIIKNSIPIQKVKDIIERIDYDIKKTKEIISKNTNIYASYRKNDYQIVRLRAMNTKSLDIKNRLQKLLESEE
jgi:hypothetical protein